MNITLFQTASAGLYPPARKGDACLVKWAIRIVNQAYLDLRQNNPSSPQARDWQQDAYEWFLSEETSPGSLVWLCQILETDPSVIRQKVFGEAEKKVS